MSKEDFYIWKEKGFSSYGEYMNKKEHVPFQRVKKPACAVCGRPLLGKRTQYCSDDCRHESEWRAKNSSVFV